MALIRTARLTLRPVLPSDVDDVHSYASDPEVSRFQDWGPSTREQTLTWVADAVAAAGTDRHPFVVVLDDKVIGTVEIVVDSHEHRRSSLGYTLARPAWGHGYATEAAAALLAHGFGELGLHRVAATCDPANVGSARVLEKIGMRREGHLKDHLLVRGEWRDRLLFAAVR